MNRSLKPVTDVHNPSKRLEYAYNVLKRKKELSERNRILIEKFASYCLSEGIGKLRVAKYIYTLGKLAEMLQMDFDRAEEEDLRELIKKIEMSNEYTEWTKRDFKIALKKFYKWHDGNGKKIPEKVEWIKTGKKINNNKLPEELITVDEVKAMAEVANNLRDKALILTLYESGARAGELLSMKIKHVVFDKYGALVMLKGKTGMRRIRLVASVPALSAWLNVHPDKDDKDAWLWCGISNTNRGERLSYLGLTKLLNNIAKRVGINKKIHPHLFRHSRATELAKHLTEAQLCQVMGWVQGSKQAATYVHLSQRDTDEAILSIYGLLDRKEKEGEKLMSIKCPRCHQYNSPEARFCYYCGMALDVKAAMEADEREKQLGIGIAQLLEDSELAREITELILRKTIEKNPQILKEI